MIRRYFLATFILLFSLSSFASEDSNAGLNCLKTSKFVLFSKAINTISLRYDDHITTQFDNGHYNSFEYTQLKTDKTSLLPKTLCSEDIKISIKEFTKSIKKNCLQQANIDEVKLYTREIASDVSGNDVRRTSDSISKAIPAAIHELKNSVNAFNKCNKEDRYVRKISSIDMYSNADSICFKIIDIMNQARKDKTACD
jgi:hypothetical protein